MKTAAMARRVHAREEDGGDDEGGVSTASGEEEDGVDGDRGDTFVHTLTAPPLPFGMKSAATAR